MTNHRHRKFMKIDELSKAESSEEIKQIKQWLEAQGDDEIFTWVQTLAAVNLRVDILPEILELIHAIMAESDYCAKYHETEWYGNPRAIAAVWRKKIVFVEEA